MRKTSDYVADLSEILAKEEDNDQLQDELNACHNVLTDTAMENGRHNVFIFQLSKLDIKLINQKLDQQFENLMVQQKSTLPWDLCYLILKSTNIVISTLMNKVDNQDIFEPCTKQRRNTKWRFKVITNVTILPPY